MLFLSGLQCFSEHSADNEIQVPGYVTSCFSVVAFNILSLSSTFENLIIIYIGEGLNESFLFGTLWVSRSGCLFTSPG